ncbi:MAG: hypothetical protein FWG94_07485 [Oscillospiraceae bacterium]|nr:hypothetical protein [Oscillospiraceae bacterium]
MGFGNNGCIWIVLIIIVLACCCGNGFDDRDNRGCNCRDCECRECNFR